jgi:superfamily II DNA/RNA helicase
LLKDICEGRQNKVLIFVKTKKGCDKLAKQLNYDGYDAVAIHGDKIQ